MCSNLNTPCVHGARFVHVIHAGTGPRLSVSVKENCHASAYKNVCTHQQFGKESCTYCSHKMTSMILNNQCISRRISQSHRLIGQTIIRCHPQLRSTGWFGSCLEGHLYKATWMASTSAPCSQPLHRCPTRLRTRTSCDLAQYLVC